MSKYSNFIRDIILAYVEEKIHGGLVKTRFAPEPNGNLHIGHAKSICLNFCIADEFGGKCNLRFDDTNPEKEEKEYVCSIREDVHWLGFTWYKECYASSYFEQLYTWAIKLIKEGLAFVCDLSSEEIREYRGSFTEPGKPSPWRNRSIEDNLKLFVAMRNGEYASGSRTLRAKIDMAHPNINMRDPVLYRIKRAIHHRTGSRWIIYPSYDFTHGQSDSIEHITHSICTLEFSDHRPLYDWFIEILKIFPSRQYELAPLKISFTVLSKRKLLKLVKEHYVNGWDDPRLFTLCGLRRRGVPPQVLRAFCKKIGVTKYTAITDVSLLEHMEREYLNSRVLRRMVVLDPIKVVLINYPDYKVEMVEAENNPENPIKGRRKIPFTRELYIDKNDFCEYAPKEYYRLKPGGEVRLRGAYIIKCKHVVKNTNGIPIRIYCMVDFTTLNAYTKDRKVKGVIHWVSAFFGVPAEVRKYELLFLHDKQFSDKKHNIIDFINPNSVNTVNATIEPALAEDASAFLGKYSHKPYDKSHYRVQFERLGYFCLDSNATEQKLIFNRTVSLKYS